MRLEWDPNKEQQNLAKHGLDFSFAEHVFSDPLGMTVYDRFEGGEHRYHAFGQVGHKLLLVVHTFPDSDDDDRLRVIGLRQATANERRRYAEENFG